MKVTIGNTRYSEMGILARILLALLFTPLYIIIMTIVLVIVAIVLVPVYLAIQFLFIVGIFNRDLVDDGR